MASSSSATNEPRVTFQQVIHKAFGRTTDVVPYPVGFLKLFQRFWIQNRIFIPQSQLEEIGFTTSTTSANSADADNNATAAAAAAAAGTSPGEGFSVHVDKLKEIMNAFAEDTANNGFFLCPILEEMAERFGGAGLGGVSASIANRSNTKPSAAQLESINKAKLVLKCCVGIDFDELSKVPLLITRQMFVKEGLSQEVSARLAGAIYKRKREATDDLIHIETPRTAAVTANARFDRFITMQNCQLSPDNVGKYFTSIGNNSKIVRLDLSGNNIHHRAADSLANDVIARLPSLMALSVAGNNLQFEGLQKVCASLVQRSIHFLDVSSNNGGPLTGSAIAGTHLQQQQKGLEGKKKMLSVRHLNASNNHITSSGVLALVLIARTCHELVIASNNFGISDGPIYANAVLNEVDEEGNSYYSAAALSGLSDSTSGLKQLIALLKACDHLSFIDISNNNLSAKTSKILLEEGLATHPSLTRMNLSLNHFKVEDLVALVRERPQIVSVEFGSEFSSYAAKMSVKNLSSPTSTKFSEQLAKLQTLNAALRDNCTKMLEFRAFLKELGVPNWTADNVRDALTFLLKRRDIAVQSPVDGKLLMSLRLQQQQGAAAVHQKDATTIIAAYSNTATSAALEWSSPSTYSALGASRCPKSDFEILSDFLDAFRDDNGDITVKTSA